MALSHAEHYWTFQKFTRRYRDISIRGEWGLFTYPESRKKSCTVKTDQAKKVFLPVPLLASDMWDSRALLSWKSCFHFTISLSAPEIPLEMLFQGAGWENQGDNTSAHSNRGHLPTFHRQNWRTARNLVNISLKWWGFLCIFYCRWFGNRNSPN